MKRRRSAFSLVEVLIAVVLLGIFIAGGIRMWLWGKYLQHQTRNKIRAVDMVSTNMEKYLAETYEGLEVGTYAGDIDLDGFENIECEISVTEHNEGVIPYKEIAVSAAYPEEDILGRETMKNIRFVNITPYPHIHVREVTLENPPLQRVPVNVYTPIDELEMTFEFPVDKDVIIIYNIALDTQSFAGIGDLDTIYTVCRVDGVNRPIETRTPIISQPLISNVLSVDGLTGGEEHTIEILWYKDTASGDTALKEANLILFAVESIE